VGARDDIRVCFNKKFQVYKANGDIGNNPSDWRDCVDISVKLAFNLSENDQEILFETIGDIKNISFTSLKDNISIQEITNTPDMYRNFPDEVKYNSFRVKQSSNIAEQKKITETLKVFSYLSKKVTKLVDDIGLNYVSEELQQKKEDVFKQFDIPEEYSKTISTFENTCIELSKINEVSLLGSSMSTIDEIFSHEG
jgi:hypothetical protein